MRSQLFCTIGILLLFLSCKNKEEAPASPVYDEAALLLKQQDHPNERMRFKLLSSKVERKDIFAPFASAMKGFTEEDYMELKPVVWGKTIPELQQAIDDRKLSYTDLTLFYLYRIHKYESDPSTSLNTVMTLNPDILNQAAERDKNRASNMNHPIYGMPILLKDNIGTEGMATTAGSVALLENTPGDAHIVNRLKEKGALILGKVNLSEWAYYFCDGCPLGYSAVGGQTLNPYGPREFETGGSSAGSGTSMAASYAVAAVGTETAGSILSPSSMNSVVGLKPTVGLLSRSGIVPISSTLDTPGPMTRNVTDNAILLDAMKGEDLADAASFAFEASYADSLTTATLKGARLGAIRQLMEQDTLYQKAVAALENAGATIVTFDPPDSLSLQGFLTLLNMDMKYDLPVYLEKQASRNITLRTMEDLVAFNASDSLIRMPYGQALFEGIVKDTTPLDAMDGIRKNLLESGRAYFDSALDPENLDAVLSVNNYHAAWAAVAKYPALTVPMGYRTDGTPGGLTFIGKPRTEARLLQLGFVFEEATKARKTPERYK